MHFQNLRYNRQQLQQVRRAVETALTEQEKAVVELRYGLQGSESLRQREVAQRLGISRSYVSRIEKRALEKLKLVLQED